LVGPNAVQKVVGVLAEPIGVALGAAAERRAAAAAGDALGGVPEQLRGVEPVLTSGRSDCGLRSVA
jgi:hypothetical protein